MRHNTPRASMTMIIEHHSLSSSIPTSSTLASTSMSTPHIPQEILDAIIDRVAELSFEYVKELSLASRCFVQRCQSRLFWKFVIPNSGYLEGDEIAELEDLRNYPTIFGYIHQLQISFDYSGTTKEETYQQSEKYNRALEEIISHMRGLKTLYVIFTTPVVGEKEVVASWGAISPTCRTTLHHLRFSNPGLNLISFYNIHDIPISFIFSNPRLDHVEFKKHSSIAASEDKASWSLKSLCCRRTGLQTVTSGHHTSPITSLLPFVRNLTYLALEIVNTDGHVDAWNAIAASRMGGLEILVLHYSQRISVSFIEPAQGKFLSQTKY